MVEFVEFFMILLLGLVIAFFYVKISLLHQFVFAHFTFLCIFYDCVYLRFSICSYTSLLHPLPPQNYAYCPLCSLFLANPKLALFFAMIMRYQILCYVFICIYFCVVSLSPHAPMPYCTHPHQSVPICTHP